jgi:two-component system CheB/CheR fusion protein
LDSTEIATIFLDNKLQIKRFTPKAAEIINLISVDVGRPLYHIVSNLKYENLIEDAENALKTLTVKTLEVESSNQQWYQVKIAPYRTISNLVDGLVITFINISAFKQLQIEFNALKKTLSKAKAAVK